MGEHKSKPMRRSIIVASFATVATAVAVILTQPPKSPETAMKRAMNLPEEKFDTH
jgi:hypothetical protein